MIYRGLMFAACLAASVALALAAPAVAPLGIALGLSVLAVFASPARFSFLLRSHPRSIFETRRAGLA